MSNFIDQCKTFIKGVRETVEIRRLQRRIQESRLQRYKKHHQNRDSDSTSSEDLPESSSKFGSSRKQA